jgi:hypothetical protein
MDADEQRFRELADEKDKDNTKFEERLHELTLYHEKITNELEYDQKLELET